MIIKLWAICLEQMDFFLTFDSRQKNKKGRERGGFSHTVFNPICFGFNLQNKAGLQFPIIMAHVIRILINKDWLYCLLAMKIWNANSANQNVKWAPTQDA